MNLKNYTLFNLKEKCNRTEDIPDSFPIILKMCLVLFLFSFGNGPLNSISILHEIGAKKKKLTSSDPYLLKYQFLRCKENGTKVTLSVSLTSPTVIG